MPVNRQDNTPVGLTCRGLCAGYDRRTVIENLDFALPAGASLAIVGESGCGKTTLLTTLAGQHAVRAGSVVWHDDAGERSLKAMRSSFVWQGLGLLPWKRVRDNLALPLRLNPQGSREQADERVAHMLEELKLSGFENRFPGELSGGQRQRLALGRALVVRPRVLFMDEPFSALDALLRERLQDNLIALRRRHPCTVVFVTHDIREAAALGSHLLVLSADPAKPAVFMENPAFDRERLCADRLAPAFARTVQHIYALLRAA